MPGRQQIGIDGLERGHLLTEHPQGEAGVQLGIAHPVALELAVLGVLDQPVVRVAGEGERIQAQRVDARESQQSQIGSGGLQMRHVELDQVVAEQAARAVGERVELLQRRGQIATAEEQALPAAGADGREGVDAVVVSADLEVHGKALGDDVIVASDRRHDPDAIGMPDTSEPLAKLPGDWGWAQSSALLVNTIALDRRLDILSG